MRKHDCLQLSAHNHTHASDGKLGLCGMLAWNLFYGFRKVAVTDHNIAAWDPTIPSRALLSQLFGLFRMRIIPGIEFSCFFELRGERKEFHITGIGIDPQAGEINQAVEGIQAERENVARRMLEKISTAGFSVMAFEELKQRSGGNITLPDIAAHVRTKDGRKVVVQEFMDGHLAKGQDCHVPNDSFLLPVEEAIRIIRAAGGSAVWAHPKYTLGDDFEDCFETVAKEFTEQGLDGIEAFRGRQDNGDTEKILNFCKRNGVAIFGGADTHKAQDLSAYIESVVRFFR